MSASALYALPVLDRPPGSGFGPAAGRDEAPAEQGVDLISALLAAQSDLTAVERFSQRHADADRPSQSRYYQSLLPAQGPGPGQQYGFEVDLDRCSGCKACVTACHSLNGLDDDEAWREVGLLHGGGQAGAAGPAVLQHVTTACHHCLEPACLKACPVDAYEKDPVTGIVRHLDDQCFGCQYCTLACPYDVPKYHAGKGIVRKCDMCADRLEAGEAPACVQACPHEAIAIRIVDRDAVIEQAEANAFLPGAPDPDYTLPTTVYKTKRALPRNLLPADYYSVRKEHGHWPLAVMLVLTQLSVGAFLVELILRDAADGRALPDPVHAFFSLAWGLLALQASTLHLGRPHLAFRAAIGLKHSWLSREIVAFGLFAPLAILYAGLTWLRPEFYARSSWLPPALEWAVVGAGLLGVFCSTMIYVVVRREFWNGPRTTLRFLGTAATLGLAATLLTGTLSANAAAAELWGTAASGDGPQGTDLTRPLAIALAVATACKLIFEVAVFQHLRDLQFTAMRRTAVLMKTVLRGPTAVRFGLGFMGGVLIPALLAAADPPAESAGALYAAAVAFALTLGGEFAERYLFFSAVVRQKMPGGMTV
ncbi:DmsC/YnfH family molybdoenzyme membrane anchor subunit [Alienimonas californiensis]|uniref:Anaerobic dimethyl sulfoxide reductase chain B n=1 Tax=Alienimonas californiensis TaxID=2527989 RepID=A0A517PE02_9PLAN|nr:DmsC/YnfH family molybdoenzyme membrane anchor subunit [Alienimonas californiensis]QDT17597.1 Anaerobic dimethyl sulfoxide reductase chain B [Alienimonas californiensis]